MNKGQLIECGRGGIPAHLSVPLLQRAQRPPQVCSVPLNFLEDRHYDICQQWMLVCLVALHVLHRYLLLLPQQLTDAQKTIGGHPSVRDRVLIVGMHSALVCRGNDMGGR